jgi:hypothetical protein
VPTLLPFESFHLDVAQKNKKRKREITSLYRYNVRPLHQITADDIFQ